MFKQNKKNHL